MGTRIPLNRVELQQQDLEEKLDLSIAEIGLSVRTTNCLEDHGILTVRDLVYRRPKELLAIANFGEKTLEEVYKALEAIGFYRTRSGHPFGGASAPGGCPVQPPQWETHESEEPSLTDSPSTLSTS